MLDRQFSLFRVDTNAFLHDEERRYYDVICDMQRERAKYLRSEGRKEVDEKKYKARLARGEPLAERDVEYKAYQEDLNLLRKMHKEYLLRKSSEAVEYNKGHPDAKRIRVLDSAYVEYTDSVDGKVKPNLNNVVGIFESTLSRSFGIRTNELTYDMFILEIYYYDIAQDLILNGFDFRGVHYVYFSSSAGQIRTKKAVFVNEGKYNAVKSKLMCGLTVESINANGGMNVNKFLAYSSLNNSATDIWGDVLGKPFDIDRAIVVDDFETIVNCKVDDIDVETYRIECGVKKGIPIDHTDGCGLISPELSNKNFMFRMPWFKGLMGVFDFKKFIVDNNASSEVTDIWGRKYDIWKDDIQIIFTKSQFKMWKYYDDWESYKRCFKENGCEAGICNIEEDKISNAKINYQMLQTLYDMDDNEIEELCNTANKKIYDVGNTLANGLEYYGVSLDYDDERSEWFQKALRVYPELLSDPASMQDLRALRDSLVKKYRSGKLDVIGKFTFILPDLYAFCERLFCGVTTPRGLLDNGEVFCRLYKTSEKLDVLRSPHLYIEHAIRQNVYEKKTRNQWLKEWFETDAIYISTLDPISRILQ